MNKIILLVVAITALDLCSARPSKYPGQPINRCLSQGQIVPTFKIIPLYGKVTLKCPFKGKVKNFIFLKHCRKINNNRVTISGDTLTLTRFVMMDGGKYSCKAEYANGQSKEFTWVLHIRQIYPGGKRVQYKERPVNGVVLFNCRHFSGKRLFYSHNKMGTRASEVSTTRMVSDISTGMYELSDLNIDDSGYYFCGDIKTTKKDLLLHLLVKELPQVKGPSIVKVGESVHFECQYKGKQTIAWYKDKIPIPVPTVQDKNKSKAKAQLKNISGNQKFLKLDLVNVQSSDSGKYSCGVTFDNNVTAYKTIKFDTFEFSNSTGFYGSYSRPNASLTVLCLSNKGNKATYSLLKKPLDKPNSPYRKVKIGSSIYNPGPGVFFIYSLTVTDEGYYQCSASFKGLTIKEELVDPVWLSTS